MEAMKPLNEVEQFEVGLLSYMSEYLGPADKASAAAIAAARENLGYLTADQINEVDRLFANIREGLDAEYEGKRKLTGLVLPTFDVDGARGTSPFSD